MIEQCVSRFLVWPLPNSVCSDRCAIHQGPGRTGTNLFTATEAKAMFEHCVPARSGPAVMMPDPYLLDAFVPKLTKERHEGWNACIAEFRRLNNGAASEAKP